MPCEEGREGSIVELSRRCVKERSDGAMLIAALCLALSTPVPPTISSKITAAVAELAAASSTSRCSLSSLGERLRADGISLPEGVALSECVQSNAELRLTGPPSNRKVGLATATTEAALVERVSAVLRVHGPMPSAELKLRLRAERQRVPGLVTLLRTHSAVFSIDDGTVRLVADRDGSSSDGEAAAASLTRLRALSLPDTMVGGETALAPLSSLREFVVIDLDNQAFVALEAAAQYAAARSDVLILAGCSSAHNPRVPSQAADLMVQVAADGRLRLLSPQADCPNGADFVLAFWVGWLHARAAEGSRFVLYSEDVSLEQTLSDLLRGGERAMVSNPASLEEEDA